MSVEVSPASYIGPDHPRWEHTLADGRHVLIRPIRRQDAAADRAFIEGLSPRSRRSRFLGQVAHPSDEQIEALTDIDYINDVALVATVRDGTSERIVGVSRYAADDTRERCECAVVVADDWQGHGVGTALMKHLITVAGERGFRLMESIDLAENHEMDELARSLGFHRRVDPDDSRQVIYALALNSGRILL